MASIWGTLAEALRRQHTELNLNVIFRTPDIRWTLAKRLFGENQIMYEGIFVLRLKVYLLEKF